jgi:regulator of RNase E activity RraA
MTSLSPEILDSLRRIDSPTIANAIEAFDVRDATEGYASLELRCMFPDLPPVVGYAVTCTVDSTTPARPRQRSQLAALYQTVYEAPKPAIVVMMDIGPQPLRGCHTGDVMSTTFQRLGAIAVVADSGVRDLDGVRQRAPGFQLFAAGTVVAHGITRIVEIGVTVTVCGLTVRPGDLLHGDTNGLVSIPHEIAGQVVEQAQQVWKREAELVEYVKGADFTIDGLLKRLGGRTD